MNYMIKGLKYRECEVAFCLFLYSQRVLGITKGMEDLGGMQWELFGTLVLGWIIVYLIIWKGLHSSGKVFIASLQLSMTTSRNLKVLVLNLFSTNFCF